MTLARKCLLLMACRHGRAGDNVTERIPGEPGVSRVRRFPITAPLRARISDLIDQRGIKGQRAFAHLTGGEISHQTVHRILSGKASYIRHDTLVALADALQTPVEVFIEDSLGAHKHDMPWQPPAEFDKLPLNMRPGIERALLALFRETRILPPADS